MSDLPIIMAFALTFFAGIATGIGSTLAFFTKHTNTKFLSISLGFSAGVMIYVSMIEIFVKAKDVLVKAYGAKQGYLVTTLAFFAGIFIIALIDRLVPSFENPHEMRKVEDLNPDLRTNSKLYRMGIFSALAIAIHNFPEGLATFMAALADPKIGVSIAVAIAIHNIPEGIAVSIPIYFATRNRKKAFTFSFLSGLSEPVGAAIGYLVLFPYLNNEALFGIVFAGVAGIMVFISLDELLPTAIEFGEHHLSIYGLIGGMIVMAISLLLFA